jgi:hypothetical protein
MAAALALAVLLLGAVARPEPAFILVRNTSNQAESLSRGQLKDMATGRKKTWPHGPPVQLVLTRPGTPELGWFASTIVGLPGETWLARVREQVFKGEMRRPLTVASEQDVLTAVAAEVGALGAVRAALARSLPAGVSVVAWK